MSKNLKPINWVDKQLENLKFERNRNKNRYVFLALLQTALNFASVIVAIWGIIRLSEHSDGSSTEVMLASFSAAGVVAIFILNNINIIYRGIMKDKSYRKALEEIQFEVMKYKSNPNEYKGKDSESKLEEVVESIYQDAITKTTKKTPTLFLRALTGGEDV